MTTKSSAPIAKPKVVSIRAGWAAVGKGWAVFAPSRGGAVAAFEAAAQKHREIVERPVSTVDVGTAATSRSG
jgi:hypothetical protein